MIWTDDFEEDILYLPAKRHQFNKLYIVTGFTDCEMIAQHLIRLHDRQNNKENKRAYPAHIEINMILGMYKRNGITLKKHEKIKETLKQINLIIMGPLSRPRSKILRVAVSRIILSSEASKVKLVGNLVA